MAISTETATKPARISPRDRAAATDDAAWAIINAESQERERKTEALRALRLKQETEQDGSAKDKPRAAVRRRIVARSRT